MVVRKALHKPVPKAALPAFTPVPRKQPRHDGWTPERQIAFIEALADTGCVAIACRMVNMSQPSYYFLRRRPGAESFRAAAEAAQTLGLQVAKDEAFDRALNGELIPVFVAGKLMGFRRKKNDRLLMFILRHYGQDAQGRKTTINYFSTRATAGAGAATSPAPSGEGLGVGEAGESRTAAAAEASTTTVKTVIGGSPNAPTRLAADTSAADAINAFEGVELDAEAQAEIYRILEACAERRRALEEAPEHDPERIYIGKAETNGYLGQLESGVEDDWVEYKPEGEHRWEGLGEGGNAAEIDKVVGEMQARLAAETPEERAAREAEAKAEVQAQIAAQSLLPKPEPDPDDPRLDWRNWETGSYAEPKAPARSAAALGRRRAPQACRGQDEKRSGPGRPACAEGDRTDVTNSVRDGPPPASKKRKRKYKPRTPKPAFTPPDAKRKAKAIEQVEAERSEAAAAEAARRERRKSVKG